MHDWSAAPVKTDRNWLGRQRAWYRCARCGILRLHRKNAGPWGVCLPSNRAGVG